MVKLDKQKIYKPYIYKISVLQTSLTVWSVLFQKSNGL